MEQPMETDSRYRWKMSHEFITAGLCCVSYLVGMYNGDVMIMSMIVCALFLSGFLNYPSNKSQAADQGKELQKSEPTQTKSTLPSSDQVMSLIKTRRSVFPRDFNGSKVSKEHIHMMLEAARFIVLEGDSKSKFESISIDCAAKYTQPADRAQEAADRLVNDVATRWAPVSHYIAICMLPHKYQGNKQNPEWEEISAVACAVQNLHLMATSLDVCGYWSSWYTSAREAPEIAQFLGIDRSAGERCLGVFIVGKSDRAGGYRGSRAPLADKVDWR